MPLYDYACECGARFEALVRRAGDPDPVCPACGGMPARRPAGFAVGGRARPLPGAETVPTSWEGTRGGDREVVAQLQRRLEARAKQEERHPELRPERRTVLAHEGRYAREPLLAPAAGEGKPAGSGHAHEHPHPHGAAPSAD